MRCQPLIWLPMLLWPGFARAAAEPALIWPAGPLEVRLAFAQPIAAKGLDGLSQRAILFESAGPPTVRGAIRIAAGRLIDDGRTLVLATDPHPLSARYTLKWPDGDEAHRAGRMLTYGLSGVEASWRAGETPPDAEPSWSLWWPDLDPDATRMRTRGSVEHERALATLGNKGLLTLRALLTLPAGQHTLTLEASGPFEVSLMGEAAKSRAEAHGVHRADRNVASAGDAIDLEIAVRTGGGKPLTLHVFDRSQGQVARQPLPADRLEVPWAPAPVPPAPAAAAPPPQLTGGDPNRGETVFFSAEAKCANCHQVRGRGGQIGPDLSQLRGRDAAALYREIAEPSATVNPDYVAFTVALKDGRVLMGVVRAERADRLRVLDTNAQQTIVARSEIAELRPSRSSIMPPGLLGTLGQDRLRDLLAFLLAVQAAQERDAGRGQIDLAR